MRPITNRTIQTTASATDETTPSITERNIIVKIDPTSAGTNQLQFEAKAIKQSEQDRDENNDSNKIDKDLESKNQIWQPDHNGDENNDSNEKNEGMEDKDLMRQSNHTDRTTAGTNNPQFDQKRDENNDSYKKNGFIEDKNQISPSDHDLGKTKDSYEKDENAWDFLLKIIRNILMFFFVLTFEVLRFAANVYSLKSGEAVQSCQ
jgi:hypothetical protein